MASSPGTESGMELVDIVDDDDRVVATVTRAEMRANRLQHRAVSIAVLSSDGRLLVHRRADTKDLWPGMWDLAAGGVVAAGETYAQAARRELETTADTLDVIATRCGFGTAETLRRSFHRRLGVAPDAYRRRFRVA